MGFWAELWEAIEEVWDYLKKIFVKILNFFNNIVSWFKDPKRLRKLHKDQNKIAFAIKQKLSNGDYNVVTGIFDQETGEVLEEDTVVYETEKLDKETAKHFGKKDLIILK